MVRMFVIAGCGVRDGVCNDVSFCWLLFERWDW